MFELGRIIPVSMSTWVGRPTLWNRYGRNYITFFIHFFVIHHIFTYFYSNIQSININGLIKKKDACFKFLMPFLWSRSHLIIFSLIFCKPLLMLLFLEYTYSYLTLCFHIKFGHQDCVEPASIKFKSQFNLKYKLISCMIQVILSVH